MPIDRVAPRLGLGERRIPPEARGGETAQIGRDIVGDFARKSPAVREAAGMRIAVGRQQWNAGHGVTRARSVLRPAIYIAPV